ncbi:MAG: 3'(2'),5'-bisphosphate nucleotidase CysQ [Thermoanaerobaculia bacterium]|nr:3'(2'),5'-bisphosphate nucleotidase CysQ [Thermoanaerobaculia bacterium]
MAPTAVTHFAPIDPRDLLPTLLDLVDEAGRAILEVYDRGDAKVTLKEDRSPLTEADLASHRILVEGLQRLTPSVPVLSEESQSIPWSERRRWKSFWLVDPLDGTKEFIRRNGEFTVNVAWIEDGVPTLGVVGVPVSKEVFFGGVGGSAYQGNGADPVPLVCETYDGTSSLRVVTSRSHPSPEVEDFLARLAEPERISVGSSLKLCLLAQNRADLYPRLGPTMEWDIAAAHAVLVGAGGLIATVEGEPLLYNKETLLSPWFIARRPGVRVP